MKMLLAIALFAILVACTTNNSTPSVEILECWDSKGEQTFKESAGWWSRDNGSWSSTKPYGSYTPKFGERCVVQS